MFSLKTQSVSYNIFICDILYNFLTYLNNEGLLEGHMVDHSYLEI